MSPGRIFRVGARYNDMDKIRIGTRGSDLALWQARHVAGLLGRERVEIVIIKTQGDKVQHLSFDKMEGKGFFTREIEDALLEGRTDLAVHSMKDLPTEETPGLAVAAITVREDPSDVLLVRADRYAREKAFPLGDGAVVGTGSFRRAAQLRRAHPGVEVRPLRGNVPTRVRRLAEGKFDAVILARAGLSRLALNLSGFVDFTLPFSYFLPAPAQGALALQVRAGDSALAEIVSALEHRETARAIRAERAFLKEFGGGCHVPLGALGIVQGPRVHLSGVIAALDGSALLRRTVVDEDPERAGAELARILKEEGADSLL